MTPSRAYSWAAPEGCLATLDGDRLWSIAKLIKRLVSTHPTTSGKPVRGPVATRCLPALLNARITLSTRPLRLSLTVRSPISQATWTPDNSYRIQRWEPIAEATRYLRAPTDHGSN
ncbi:unnamed protein product [Leptosia nina]|uniref:Uncharacterized protein n=1 Tax=Leptosia nina TaxID=320188 RepID=A0AAV1K4G1_9NEOP